MQLSTLTRAALRGRRAHPRKELIMYRLVTVLCALGCGFSAYAIDLPVAADATIRSNPATLNFGGLPQLQVDSASQSLLGFDLSSLPPSLGASQLVRASLTLYASRVVTPGTVILATNAGPWQESLVTRNAQPPAGGVLTSIAITEAGRFYTMDVTAAVASWLSTPFLAAQGLRLSSAGSSSVFFDSKENTATSHAPMLTLVFSGPQGPQGTQGVQGPQGIPGPSGATGPAGPSTVLNMIQSYQTQIDVANNTTRSIFLSCTNEFPYRLSQGCGSRFEVNDVFLIYVGPSQSASGFGQFQAQCTVSNRSGATRTILLNMVCSK